MLLLCPFFGQQLAAQTVVWQPNPVKQGQKTIISYQPKGGDLEFSDEPKAIVAVYSDFQWRSTPVSLSKQNDSWTGSYQVPEQASFIALKFYQGDLESPEAIDIRNGNGYFTSILGKNGKPVPGAYLAEASLRAGLTGNMAMNSFVKLSKDKRLVDSLLQKEERLNKNIPDKLIFNYLDLKQLTMPVAAYNAFADSVLRNELKKKMSRRLPLPPYSVILRG
ncbi:hypothetical protein [Pedobacter sp. P26]|uniref:hypothetical protein n=1 Tax=Pedobacter sp. P26 TaxID=3423956 RepID=UPI003D6732C0